MGEIRWYHKQVNQNRRQKVFNKGALRLFRGASHSEIHKNSTDVQCFIIQFGGAWNFVWGAKTPEAPRGDGTEVNTKSIKKACET